MPLITTFGGLSARGFAAGSTLPIYVLIATFSTPYVHAYQFDPVSGWGLKFPDPGALPAGTANGVTWSPSGDVAFVAGDGSPYFLAYPRIGAAFGSKHSDPATPPTGNTLGGCSLSPSGASVAVARGTDVYPWNDVTGFGTRHTNPGTGLSGGASYAVAFAPGGDAILYATASTPYLNGYPWNDVTGFGTKYSNPIAPPGYSTSVAVSPSGAAVALGHNVSPFVTVLPFNAVTGFGTKYANPSTLPPDLVRGVAFSPAGNLIAVAIDVSPYVILYEWNDITGFGAKLPDPASLPTGGGFAVAFSPDGSIVVVAHLSSPYVSAYPCSPAGLGVKFPNPSVNPGSNARGVALI